MANIQSSRWYHTWWGVVLLSSAFLVVVLLSVFVGTIVKYWWQIKHGQTPAFVTEYAARFTQTNNQAGYTVNRTTLETPDSPWLGRFDAPLTIVEFVDFKCPNCKIEAPILHQVDALYHNKVHIIIRHFPAESLHPGATPLAYLGYCAHRQGKFWPVYDLLYNQQDTLPNPLDDASIANLAAQANLSLPELTSCLAANATQAAVTKDYLAGISAGVRGTPTFFVNGVKVEGAIPFEAWKKYLDQQ